MAFTAQRLDPDRYRRRLRLLAEISDTRALRMRLAVRQANLARIQHLVAARRQAAGPTREIRWP